MKLSARKRADILFWEKGICKCPEIYSIETHGNGWALYFGRCNHRHGWNLANMTEIDFSRWQIVLNKLNSPKKVKMWKQLTGSEELESEI